MSHKPFRFLLFDSKTFVFSGLPKCAKNFQLAENFCIIAFFLMKEAGPDFMSERRLTADRMDRLPHILIWTTQSRSLDDIWTSTGLNFQL